MHLKNITYSENKGQDSYWKLEKVNLDQINLIVGRNATGKTRLKNVIAGIAQIIASGRKYSNGCFQIDINANNSVALQYCVEIHNSEIVAERLTHDGRSCLNRSKDKCKIYSATQKKEITIEPPSDKLVLQARRDVKEYPFFEDLVNWAESVRTYDFAAVNPTRILNPVAPEFEAIDLSIVPHIVKKSIENQEFIDTIIADFTRIGFPINQLSITELSTADGSKTPLVVVNEKGLGCSTQQTNMSQGMYRAFTIVVLIDYIKKQNQSATIVIDDLGEGLDFERSSNLMKLLIEKVEGSEIQLIVTTNDRFLMNAVDLKQIKMLRREKNLVKSYDYSNHQEDFDDFTYTGLNNFDFFSKGPFSQEFDKSFNK